MDLIAEVGRRAGVHFVVATGGGTVMDTGKAVARMIPARKACSKWLQAASEEDGVVPVSPLPLVLVPTTLVGGLAAGSPRAHVRVDDEELLSAPRW